MTAEYLAELFHMTYEELAPKFGYKTREESAVKWAQVPEKNRALMIAVAEQVMAFAPILRENSMDYALKFKNEAVQAKAEIRRLKEVCNDIYVRSLLLAPENYAGWLQLMGELDNETFDLPRRKNAN